MTRDRWLGAHVRSRFRTPLRQCTAGLVLAVAASVATGCAQWPAGSSRASSTRAITPNAQASPVIFIVLRHAEKADPGNDSSGNNDHGQNGPGLSDAGQARAARIADALREAPLGAVYTTDYRRTRQTATPAAATHGLDVTVYDARLPAAEFAARLRARPPAGTVLVVGHSNTAPAIAAALCTCPVEPTGEEVYDRWLEIRTATDGSIRLHERRY